MQIRLAVRQVESLEEQIVEVKAEIAKYKGQGTTTDNQRKQVSGPHGTQWALLVLGTMFCGAGGQRGWASVLRSSRSLRISWRRLT
jgi:hypothetical protein